MRLPRRDPTLNDAIEALEEKYIQAQQKSKTDVEIMPLVWSMLDQDEMEFIDREIHHCTEDRRYFMENYYVIRDEVGNLRSLYPFFDHQEIIYEVIQAEYDAKGCVRLIILKPRQAGSTTWNAAMIFHDTVFVPNAYSLVMAQRSDVSLEIYQRIMDAYHNLPFFMRPETMSKQQGQRVVFQRQDENIRLTDPGLGSTLLVSDAQKSAGVAIGRTIRNGLFSEVSRWPDAQVWTADIRPSLNAPDMFCVMESTAFGRSGLYYNMWNAAEKGKSNWRALFIPVYKVRKYSMPVYKSEKFTLTSDERKFRQAVWDKEQFKIALGFFKWYRSEEQESINSTGSDEACHESYPRTPEEAFISSGSCAFPKKELDRQKRLHVKDPALIGEIEYDGPDQAPILHLHPPEPGDLEEKPDRFNRLWVWELPKEAGDYQIGADVGGTGEENDFSAAAVYSIGIAAGEQSIPDVQVAEWHGHINASHFARVLAALGYWYNSAEIAVEYEKQGITTGNELQWTLDYPQIYRWRRLDKVGNTLSMHTHWLTNSVTREDMINRLAERLLDHQIEIRNHHALREMFDFGREEGGTRAEGMSNNDDMCLVPGTKVLTIDGYKSIESVVGGELVLGHDAQWHPVLGKMSRRISEFITGIRVWGIPDEIQSTGNHPILIRRRRWAGSSPIFGMGEAQWIRADEVRKGDFVWIPKRPLQEQHGLTDEELYLLGWFLGDGYIGSNNAFKIIGGLNDYAVLRRLEVTLWDFVRKNPTFWTKPDGRYPPQRAKKLRTAEPRVDLKKHSSQAYWELKTWNKALAAWIHEWVGFPKHKFVSTRIYNSVGIVPYAVGFVEADGSQTGKRKALAVTQKDRQILLDVQRMLWDNDIWATISPRLDAGGSTIMGIGVPEMNRMLSVFPGSKFVPQTRQLFHPMSHREKNGYWVPVRSARKIPYRGLVYNFSIAECESYTANGIAVHNCMAHMISIASANQSNRRQLRAEELGMGTATNSSVTASVMPKVPKVYLVVDQYGRQLEQVSSEAEGMALIERCEKKYKLKLKGLWTVQPVVVMAANTPMCPALDRQGAESELFRQGMDPKNMYPEIIQIYKDLMNMQRHGSGIGSAVRDALDD